MIPSAAVSARRGTASDRSRCFGTGRTHAARRRADDQLPRSSTAAAPPPRLTHLVEVPGSAVGGGSSYFAGTLVRRSDDSIAVLDSAAKQWTIRVNASTEVCLGPCGHSASVLHPGDRIDAGISLVGAPPFGAEWIQANGVADYVHVDTVNADHLTVHSTRHPDEVNPPYVLIVGPATILTTATGSVALPAGGVKLGDDLYFTGSTVDQTSSIAIATRVFPLSSAS